MEFKNLIVDLIRTLWTYAPRSILIGALVAICLCVITLVTSASPGRTIINNGKKFFLSFLWIIYISFIMIVVFLNRAPGSREEIHLSLFGTFAGIYSIYPIENILLFIPMGFLLAISHNKFSHSDWCISMGFFLSVTIEVLQFIYKRGYFEIDDILMNTVGTAIGLGIRQIIRISLQVKRN